MNEAEKEEPQITFHTESKIPFLKKTQYRKWLKDAIMAEGKLLSRIAYSFVSDQELLELNQKHLRHDTFTDILTFPYSYDPIEADIYISLERVAENAKNLGLNKEEECRRVMIHGVLHMCGHHDKTPEEQSHIRALEDKYLLDWD